MHVQYEVRDHIIIARVSGSLTGGTASELEEKLLERLDRQAGAVLLDLSDLDYISSSGIGAVVKLYRDIQERQSNLAVVSAAP